MEVLYNIKFELQGIKFRTRTIIPTFWLPLVHNSLIYYSYLLNYEAIEIFKFEVTA